MSHLHKLAFMIHGAGGGGWEWDLWAKEFEFQGWSIATPDLQPHNDDLESTRFENYLDQLSDMLKGFNPDRLVFIGASMGGALAIKLAETLSPSSVILVNPAPPSPIDRPNRRSYPPIVRWAGAPIEDSRQAMPDCDEATIAFAAHHWRDESGRVLNEIVSGYEAKPPTCPVLVIVGGSDDDVPAEVSFQTAKWANADLHLYQGMSHVGPLLGMEAGRVVRSTLHWLDSQV